MNTFQNYFNRH